VRLRSIKKTNRRIRGVRASAVLRGGLGEKRAFVPIKKHAPGRPKVSLHTTSMERTGNARSGTEFNTGPIRDRHVVPRMSSLNPYARRIAEKFVSGMKNRRFRSDTASR